MSVAELHPLRNVFCPMGCGRTIWTNIIDGSVKCRVPLCPNPNAVTELLQPDQHTHIVQLEDGMWTVQHPLVERLNDGLFHCDIVDVADEALDYHGPGRYRTGPNIADVTTWERIE